MSSASTTWISAATDRTSIAWPSRRGRASWARSRRQQRGETREVEFVGIGVQTGAAKLKRQRSVAFPAAGASFDYRLDTPMGAAAPFTLLLSDLPENGRRQGRAPWP